MEIVSLSEEFEKEKENLIELKLLFSSALQGS
jgi:hypothetical protein